jgi:hypothetical protein
VRRFALWALFLTPVIAGEDEMVPLTPYTDNAILVHNTGSSAMTAELTKVPLESNRYATMCLEFEGRRQWQCFYVDKRDNSVEMIPVAPRGEKL